MLKSRIQILFRHGFVQIKKNVERVTPLRGSGNENAAAFRIAQEFKQDLAWPVRHVNLGRNLSDFIE